MTKMTMTHSPLTLALAADAVASGATGLLMAAGAGPLSSLLGLPQPLLLYAGVGLLPFALFVGMTARRMPARNTVTTIAAVNLLWTLASFAVLFLLPQAPTLLGYAFVTGQALVVAAFAALQMRFAGMASGSARSAA